MSIEDKHPREILRGLMRGNREELRLGYSPANAVMAVTRLLPNADLDEDELRGYSQGFSDGVQRLESMASSGDTVSPETDAYCAGYLHGLAEPMYLTYPSRVAV